MGRWKRARRPYAALALACALSAAGACGGDGGGGAASPDASASDTGGDAGARDSGPDGAGPGDVELDFGARPEWFRHSCGDGGATGEWTSFEVPYPEGTEAPDGTPVTTARYHVLAPDLDYPLPLVVAIHGDVGTSANMQAAWQRRWESQPNFIVLTPQEPHQERCPQGEENTRCRASNGWDDYQGQTIRLLRTIFADVAGRYDIDADRVYVVGNSAGAWFGSKWGTVFQDVFAAAQWNCGGSGSLAYREVDDPACRLPVRFEISESDFLYVGAVDTAAALLERGHEVEFSTTDCRGHCCGPPEQYVDAAWAWFASHTLCDATPSASECVSIGETD